MKVSCRKSAQYVLKSMKFFILCLLLIAVSACVSQKPKIDLPTVDTASHTDSMPANEQAQAGTAQDNTDNKTAQEATVNQSAGGASASSVHSVPEIIALYQKPPEVKQVIAVLLSPALPEPVKQTVMPGTNNMQSSAIASGANSAEQGSNNTQQGSANPEQGTTNTQQSAANNQQSSGTTQQSAGAGQPGSAQSNSAQAGTKPASQTGQSGSTTVSSQGNTKSTGGVGTQAGSTAASQVQPVIPFPTASSTAAIVTPQNAPVPAAELIAEKNKTFIVTLSGNGWIYLGDEYSRQGVRYESRQLIDNQIVYRLNSDRTGEFLLRFQRDNPVTQLPEISYVKVTVVDSVSGSKNAGISQTNQTAGTASGIQGSQGAASTQNASSAPQGGQATSAGSGTGATGTGTVQSGASAASGTGSVTSPGTITGSGGTAVPGTGAGAGGSAGATTVPGTSTGIVSGTGTTSSAGIAPTAVTTLGTGTTMQYSREMIAAMNDASTVLDIARTQLAQKQITVVLAALDRYLVLNPAGNDEVLYLYALAYEQDTPYRDVQKAYTYYKQLIREYPLSTYRQYALERITYLERYYPGLR